MSDFDPDILASATAAQRLAAKATASVFVEANAGSGKTRVLVDRVVNILLTGVEPDRILCVTYTKAAAAEMKDRLFQRLGRWSIAGEEELRKDLKALLKRELRGDELAQARRLFAKALETPGGLKIQTIHAFCEMLLRRFPLEAGAPPGFETLDDSAAREIVAAARRRVLRDVPEAVVAQLLATGGPDAPSQVMAWARANRQDFGDALARAGSPDALGDAVYAALGLERGETAGSIKAAAWEAADRARLAEVVEVMLNHGKPTDHKRAPLLKAALDEASASDACDRYLEFLFTANGKSTRVKNPVTASCDKAAPGMCDRLRDEQERLEAVRDRVRAVDVAEASEAAIAVASRFIEAYEDELARRRALDFDDLVRLAGDLLRPENAFSGWVGYKLDGRLEHALVDEAQDTAPRQWDMIRGLTAEFFAGEGASEQGRTLFIVGDEKQSIYSFQGAEPARFMAEGERLGEAAGAVGLDFERPGLDVSFRSAPEVLAAVDQAFASEAAAPEVKFAETGRVRPFAHYQGHRAARRGTPGCVELWPAVPMPDQLVENSIFEPVDQRRRGSSRDVLAQSVAEEIRAMLERGDAVWHEEAGGFSQRPVEPRDIAILVWRRTAGFFEEVIRQLKLAGVPVAGADRMVLKDQTAVKDMLALARFAVTPGDDLALAEVLKSPFFDPVSGAAPLIDDAVLMELAAARRSRRRGTLWNALFTSTDARLAEAREALAQVRDQADKVRLYDLFAGFLNARTPTGETRWARMFARLGEEARDPLEEFLTRALEHESQGGGSLAAFIAGLEGEDSQLKREMSQDRNEVQVMTVHASKGLERPVIILPDTTRSPLATKADGILSHEAAGLVWSPRKEADPALAKALREARDAKALAEHDRLLYVALTRARDRLIVCGWKQGRAPGLIKDDSWYARLSGAWGGAGWAEFETPLARRIEDIGSGLRFGPAPRPLGAARPQADVRTVLPDWASTPAASEAAAVRGVAPSSFLSDETDTSGEPAVISPLADPGGHRFRRGDIIHKLLETLPDLPEVRRREAAERFVAAQPDIDDAARRVIVEETLGILAHPDFAPLFGPGSRAEVSLVGHAPGLPEGIIVRGQVDRLVVTDTEVLIIDYKTNRPPPIEVADVARVYLGQMATYRALLRAVHPGKTVRCALLWTDAARLMELPDELLDTVFARSKA
ncbi:double-strand break repair helicase AddA [Maricaulis sp. CAU 1757]